jgi:hypothetical protein
MKIVLAFIFALINCYWGILYAGVSVKESSVLPVTPIKQNTQPYPIFDKDGKPEILFQQQPSKDINMSCLKDNNEVYYFPIYPYVFYVPCPHRSLVAKNDQNGIKWATDLTDYNGGQIGYSKDGIVLHSFDKHKLDIINIETGTVIGSLPTKLLHCPGYPRSALYTKADNNLYVFCSEGVLKRASLQSQVVETVFETHKQFLTQVPASMNNMQIDSSGRFLIYSETMGSRANSWGGVAVYDLKAKKRIFSKNIYQASWDVNIAVGLHRDFFVQYLCYENKNYNVCGSYYLIQENE